WIRSPTTGGTVPAFDFAPTTTAACMICFPPEHSIIRPAALKFGAVLFPVAKTAIGPTPLRALPHLSFGTLYSAVTLLAAFWANAHPPKVVLVAGAAVASLSVPNRSPAEGPVWAKAGTVPLTASSNDPSTARVAPTLRLMRTGTPPWLCVPAVAGLNVPAVAAIFFHGDGWVNAPEMRTERQRWR